MSTPKVAAVGLNDAQRFVLGAIVDGVESSFVNFAHGKHATEADRNSAMYKKDFTLVVTRAVRTGDKDEVARMTAGLTTALGLAMSLTVPPDLRASFLEAVVADAIDNASKLDAVVGWRKP